MSMRKTMMMTAAVALLLAGQALASSGDSCGSQCGTNHSGVNSSGWSASGTDIISYSRARHQDLSRLKAMARLNQSGKGGGSVGTATCNCGTGGSAQDIR